MQKLPKKISKQPQRQTKQLQRDAKEDTKGDAIQLKRNAKRPQKDTAA